MTVSAADARFMARAMQLARRGMYTSDPNPRVGCVIVKDGRIIGEGWHERAGQPHAEINALSQAGKIHSQRAGVYVTLEPCCHSGRTPPCTQALIDTGVMRVVAAMRDPNPQVAGKGFRQLEANGIQVNVGLMEREAEALNPGFISRMKRGRPYVRVKLAASLDGRTAMVKGESKWITSEAARADVQKWRARSSAIVTGVSTVLADNPMLTVRDMKLGRQPLRVVVDSRLRTPPTARLFQGEGKTLIVAANQDINLAENLKRSGAEVVYMATEKSNVDLTALMKHLAWLEANEVLIEAGETLCGAMLKEKLVDEIVLYYGPHVMGSCERGMFMLPSLTRMANRIKLDIIDSRPIGKDWRVIVKVSEK
jgi:diaminohydroxyphosphoribosylaminopyrimidine deaminase/5-amino-6-(5-phosphoribosylamino)uracil reductase